MSKLNYLIHLNVTVNQELTNKDMDILELLLRAFYADKVDNLNDIIVADYEDITEDFDYEEEV